MLFNDEGETAEESVQQVEVEVKDVGQIFSDLQAGANVTKTQSLKANDKLSSRGVMITGSGFIIEKSQFNQVELEVQFAYLNARDFMQSSRQVRALDFFGMDAEEAQQRYPKAYQLILERVKPERDASRNSSLRKNWWIFERPRPELRAALKGLKQYIATVETSKHRIFIFIDKDVLADNKLLAIALEDAYFLGTLSSKIHVNWALACGAQLGPTPVYAKSSCFDPFPFPDPTSAQKQKIRELGERLDAHRKKVQSQSPDVTITGMYNLLEKLKAGQPFTDADRIYNDKALVSTLKQIHDELDAAVLDAYGWEQNISNEEILNRLVALNAERAVEERNGLIRWLRPEYQAPTQTSAQMTLAGITDTEEIITVPVEQKTWPKTPKDQLAAIRDLLRTTSTEWTAEQVAAQFKGASRQKKTITQHLESLEWFGILLSRSQDGISRWHYAELRIAG